MKINVGFGRSTAQKAVSSANKHYLDWSKEHNINSIKTLADYYNVKYNDSKRYALLQGYVKAVNSCSFVYSVKYKLIVQATSFGEDIMIIINDINKKFVKNHIPKADEILNSDSVRDALEAFSDWLDMNPDCWDENGYDYSDLGRQAQKVYDDILYDNVYANKSNA